MTLYFNIALLILSVLLIVLVMVQAKGNQLGSIFGGNSGVYRTRRGVESTVYNMTIVVAVLFVVTAVLSALLA